MPHVPIGGSSKDFEAFTITHSKGAGGKWSVWSTRSTVERTVGIASVSRSKGPKVMKGFGWWAPSRPYVRTAKLASVKGGPEVYGNAVRPELATVWYERSGYPSNGLTTTGLLPNFGSAETQGLVSGDIPVISTNLRNRLIAECMQKVGDRKINLGESLAEGRKTISHIARTSMQVLGAYKALRRGNIPAALKALKLSKRTILSGRTASERWLELQYGWYPLLSDIYSAGQILQNGVQRKQYLIYATRQISANGAITKAPWSGSVECTYRCKLVYSVSSRDLDALARFGFINPAEVAWALMPYSFVIDWFLPIGALLEAYSATVGLTYVDGHITSRALTKASRVVPGSLAYTYYSGQFEQSIDYFGMQRQIVVTASPLPYVKSPFSSTHLLSALALLRSLR